MKMELNSILVLKRGMVFFLLATVLLGGAVTAQQAREWDGNAMGWDRDGGVSHDYSDIPRLKWMDTEPPGTYAEFMQDRAIRPFSTEFIYKSSRKGRLEKALVLVNSDLLPSIWSRLFRYALDIEADGYTVEVHATSGGTPEDLKNFFLDNATDLKGCVLVGDHPVAWYEMEIWDPEQFPCDLYLMDLDGDWTDSDNDGLWDGHTAGDGDEGPEIFIGHIDASMMSGDEAEMMNSYFDKNHAFRTGQISLPGYGLTYTEDDWAMFNDMKTNIHFSYPEFQQIAAPDTIKTDYLNNRVPNPEYGFIQLACHSSSSLHQFTRGGNLLGSKIRDAKPTAPFFNLFCCSSLRYTKGNFLGGSYIYDAGDRCLAVIGSTKTGSMLVFHAFYKPFGQGNCFGEAFRMWFNTLAPYNNNEKAWHFGMTIAGDPFLFKREPTVKMSFPNGLPDEYTTLGMETPIQFEIEDCGETYAPGSAKLHYRFSSAAAFETVDAVSLGGNLYEAVIPHTSAGDQPEFYFSAGGGNGGVTRLPHNAPDDVYTFTACLVTPLFEDDFETDQGWTVSNLMMDTGEWELAEPGVSSAQPGEDHSVDGTQCYVTGKLGGAPSFDDVDGVGTFLYSPKLALNGSDALISFYLWFYHSSGGTQQPLEITLIDDDNIQTKIMEIEHDPQWNLIQFRVSDFITPPNELQFMLRASDFPDDDIVEALIDDVTVMALDINPTLWADGYSVIATEGADMRFTLGAGVENASRTYLLLGNATGTSPGTQLPDGSILPLNFDMYTDLILGMLGSGGFTDFTGKLDATGKATVDLISDPIDPVYAGIVMNYAYILGPSPYFVSNAVGVTLD